MLLKNLCILECCHFVGVELAKDFRASGLNSHNRKAGCTSLLASLTCVQVNSLCSEKLRVRFGLREFSTGSGLKDKQFSMELGVLL